MTGEYTDDDFKRLIELHNRLAAKVSRIDIQINGTTQGGQVRVFEQEYPCVFEITNKPDPT